MFYGGGKYQEKWKPQNYQTLKKKTAGYFPTKTRLLVDCMHISIMGQGCEREG